ncbi:MAG: hypothetical protein OXJ52_04215 [Oligoflexia bacterium]|nr:hypothetical protein [Oligoflexia bacterium]
MRMRIVFDILFILSSVFLISCKKEYSIADPSEFIDILPEEDPYKPEINLPKEIRIYGKYTLTKNNKSFQFEKENKDKYCYTKSSSFTSESIVPLRFKLYNKTGKLVSEGLPVGGEGLISEFNERIIHFPDIKTKVTIFSSVPYHTEGVKIKAILVDDEGKHLKVLAERRILTPEEFRQRFFYKICYMGEGFGIE